MVKEIRPKHISGDPSPKPSSHKVGKMRGHSVRMTPSKTLGITVGTQLKGKSPFKATVVSGSKQIRVTHLALRNMQGFRP